MAFKSNSHFGFGVAVAFYVAAVVTWYATLPHLSSWTAHVMYGVILICAVLAALLDRKAYVPRAVTLGVVMGVCNGLVHWLGALAGAPVDAGTLAGALFLALLSMPIHIGLSIVGGLAVWGVCALRKAR